MAATSESSSPKPQKITIVLKSSAPSVERTALEAVLAAASICLSLREKLVPA